MDLPPSPPPTEGEISFLVSYRIFNGADFNRDLKGKGLLTISGSPPVYRFAGKRRSLFGGKPVEVTFSFADIYNVLVRGRMVRFSVNAARAVPPFVFFCDTADQAAEVAALLPARMDADLVASRNFAARLNELAGHRPMISVTNAIIAANVVVFLVMAGLLGAGWGDVTDLAPYIRYGASNGAATTDGEWWRLLTSMFMHYGLLHLALNMWALYQSGDLLERMQGRVLFTVTYLGCGIGGGLLSLVWHGDKVWSAGASGAIFGVYGAVCGYMLREKHALPAGVFKPMLRSTLTFAGYNLVYGMVHPAIDNAAHIGGLLTGLVLGWVGALPIEAESRARLAGPRLRAVLGAVLVIIVAGVAAAPHFNYSVRDEVAWGNMLKGVGDKETELMARQQKELVRWEQKHDNLDACAQLIEGEMIPFYTDLARKLDTLQLAPGRLTAQRRDALREFARFRLEAYPHLLAGLRGSDDHEIQAYKALEEKASTAINRLSKL